jgi:hypothetical protein
MCFLKSFFHEYNFISENGAWVFTFFMLLASEISIKFLSFPTNQFWKLNGILFIAGHETWEGM